MAGLFNIKGGANAIQFCCKPLEHFLTNHSIGRFLQFTHLFGYLALVVLILFFPSTRLTGFIILSVVLFMFIAFNGCILTSAEMHYLEKKETVPGILLETFHIRPVNKETDYFVQKSGSIAALVAPIIFILWTGGVKSNYTLND
jgi:hypothetical protein